MRGFTFLITAIALAGQLGCSKKTSTDDSSSFTYTDSPTAAQESAMLGVENAASSSEGSPVTTWTGGSSITRNLSPNFKTACSALTFSACSSGATSMTFGNCTMSDTSGNSITFSGDVNGMFSATSGGTPDTAACTSVVHNNGTLPTGDTMNLVYDMTATFTSVPSVPALSGMQVMQNFNPGTAWDGTTFPSASSGYVVSNSSGTRSVSFNGLHNEILSASGSVYVNWVTSGTATVTGSLAAGTRSLANGSTFTTWHNRAQYKVVHTTGSDGSGHPVTWTSSSCCHPTEGKLTSVYTGSTTGTATLIFSTACGEATLTDVNGNTSTVELPSC